MSKLKTVQLVEDEEFLAQLDFLRTDYDADLLKIEELEKDIHRLIAILVERDIPIPDDILERYVKVKVEGDEELPFQ